MTKTQNNKKTLTSYNPYLTTAKAFTLLELLLVIAVIASLAGIILFALNPAQRLEDASNTKALSTAIDLEKAIKVYSIDNSGNLPSSLQSVTTSGIYDICKSGQTIGCINLDELVTSGKLSSIPEDSRFSTTYKSGYKLDFNPAKAESKVYSQTDYEQVTKYCPPGDTCLPPVAEWLFDEVSGSIAYDSSGNNNNGTLTNGPVWSDGKYNNAILFDGLNDSIQLGTSNKYSSLNKLSLSTWIYLTSYSTLATESRIFEYGGGSTPNTILFYITNTGYGKLLINNSAVVTTSTTIPLNQWVHIAATYSGSSSLQIYVDGINKGINNTSIPANTNTGSMGIALGNSYQFGNTWGISGKLDNLKIYNYTRTPEQIAWEYNEGLPYAHWKFDESSGTIAYDSSGNSKNATLLNGATFSSGKYGNAITLDGMNDYLTVASMGSFNKFTVTAWIKTSTGSLNNIVSGSSAAIYPSIRSNKLSWFDGISWRDGTTTLTDGQWKHVAFVFANGAHYMYVNGNIEYNNNAGNGSYTTGSIGYIGAVYTPDRYFNGQIDDMKVYNYALTKSQIMQSMHEI